MFLAMQLEITLTTYETLCENIDFLYYLESARLAALPLC